MDLADEMAQWEVHALRNLTATLLLYVRRACGDRSAMFDAGALTPAGCLEACEAAFEEFERGRRLAFHDRHYRLDVIRDRPSCNAFVTAAGL